jgi:hypothetical protein
MRKIYFLFIFVLLGNSSIDQTQTELGIKKFISKISNNNVLYGVTMSSTWLPDSAGDTLYSRRVVFIVDKKQRYFIEHNSTALYPYLIKLFDDEQKDWAANIILYYISKRRATGIAHMTVQDISLWRKARKNLDRKYWIDYFERTLANK